MKTSLFITGASGFVAGNFLRKINVGDFQHIYCLSRTTSKTITDLCMHPNVTFIQGRLHDSVLYSPYLFSTDAVLHLAAVTGKARPKEYFDVNAKGTEFLVKQCVQAGVKNFLHVSTIAVKFDNVSHYYYAQSKQQSEDFVRRSGINYAIVRPTIIIGKESSIWNNFLKLASAPVPLLFGNGKVKIQPIYIDDMIDCLLTIIQERMFSNEVFELGGPDIISIENFLVKIYRMLYKKNPKIIHIPLSIVVPLLSFMENFFYSLLPFTTGQLSTFRYDGTAKRNTLFERHVPKMKHIDEMIRTLITNE